MKPISSFYAISLSALALLAVASTSFGNEPRSLEERVAQLEEKVSKLESSNPNETKTSCSATCRHQLFAGGGPWEYKIITRFGSNFGEAFERLAEACEKMGIQPYSRLGKIVGDSFDSISTTEACTAS